MNTASKCGFTPQYKDLQQLYTDYKDKNFVIIGFPANNFGQQEPGTSQEISEFCTKNYGVTFPMAEKVNVVGDSIAPLFKYLTDEAHKLGVADPVIGWNFTKFVIDRNGNVIARYASATKPQDSQVTDVIEKALAAKAGLAVVAAARTRWRRPSSRRSTRSDGCAPLASQSLAFS